MPALPSVLVSLSVSIERLTLSRKLRLHLHEARSFRPVPTKRALGLIDAITRRRRVLVVDRVLSLLDWARATS
jgi:hypothetical protein